MSPSEMKTGLLLTRECPGSGIHSSQKVGPTQQGSVGDGPENVVYPHGGQCSAFNRVGAVTPATAGMTPEDLQLAEGSESLRTTEHVVPFT